MKNIATLESIGSAHGDYPATTVPLESSDKITILGVPVILAGTPFSAHPHATSGVPHSGTAIATGGKVTVGGKAVVLEGDAISCGSTVVGGSSLLTIKV